ncbi:MAG: SurA N-terminal domain-containing protein [SAR86 cluster bacterium]|uniref:Periplasmic chaperone PpiD n=1 Tax=SAR86 cluster bacterium TaxID=2030880 RepID=A0A937J620_9GAMM|nr:SurA N-terminal domain-containing protein [SAR86 cluster bacterium]|tara:strand:- start:3537 stop:5375 length:1839 start_codon:yes stop_codon:yes gene_type:complete
MLESLRSFLSGKTLLIFVTIMAIPFVFFGSSSVGTIFTTYGKVNGLEVSQADLNSANNTVNQRLLETYGEDFSMPEDILLEMVKEEIISQKTLLSQTRDMGILVSENDAKDQIMMSPNFQTDGQFDEIAFETAIRTQGYTPNDYISIVTEGMAKNYLIDSIASSFFTLDNEILDIAKLIEQERDITFTKIDFNALKSTIQADLTEAKAYYESNSINFFSNEERSMNYITINNDDYRSLVEVPDNYLEEAYEDYLQRIEMRSEKRASHIMVDLVNYPSKAEALKIITLAEKELNSGKDFNEVVLTYSEDIISKELDGDIGYSSGDVFPDEFENALAKMTKGEVSDIIFSEATNSFHILKLTEINQEVADSFDNMKDALLEELVSAESQALMDEDRDIIDNAILDNLSLEELAQSLGLEIKTSGNLTLENFDFEIKNSQIAQTLFSIPSGFNSAEVIELEEGMVVMSLNTIQESTLMPFDSVIENAIDSVRDQKALALSLSVQESMKTDTDFDKSASYISQDNFIGVQRFSSLLPAEVLQKVFVSQTNEQFQVTASNGDSYLMTVNSVNSPDDDFLESLVDEYKEFSKSQVSNKMATLVFDELRNSAKVNLQNL